MILFCSFVFAAGAIEGDPAVLPASIVGHDLYATDDPVPNGPIKVFGFSEHTGPFYDRQCEVTHCRSVIEGHTTYWSAKDDFVARVIRILAAVSTISICQPRDDDWLDVSALRRHWRVGLLAKCCMVADVAIVGTVLSNKQNLHRSPQPKRGWRFASQCDAALCCIYIGDEHSDEESNETNARKPAKLREHQSRRSEKFQNTRDVHDQQSGDRAVSMPEKHSWRWHGIGVDNSHLWGGEYTRKVSKQ